MSSGSLISFQAPADALTYEPFYGLKEKPFGLNSDPRFVYDSPSYAATFESLEGGIRRREGLLVLTGEIGTGKTTLCRDVVRTLGRKAFSSFVPDPFASREDLLKMLLVDFGVMSIQDLTAGPLRQASRTELSYLLAEFVDSVATDAFVVAIIDEAQNMTLPLIEETRILSDSFGGKGRLQLIFVGQPELHTKLQLPEMRQVDQRVCGYNRLAPLGRDAVAGYIQHRLRVAGGSAERELFPSDIIDIIHGRSGGVPRLVNRICDRALHLAHKQQAAAVDREILDTALLEVGSTTLAPTWASIVSTEPEVIQRPAAVTAAPAAVAATPAIAPQTSEAATVEAPPVDDDQYFAKRIDEWVTKELAPPTRVLTSLPVFVDETRPTAGPRPLVPPQTESRKVPFRPIARDSHGEPRCETYMQRLMRRWRRRAAIASASVTAVAAASLLVAYLPNMMIGLMGESPVLPALPEAPAVVIAGPVPVSIDQPTPQPVAPATSVPVESPAPVAVAPSQPIVAAVSANYLVSVGLFANRERADQLVASLTQAGLPAVQRPFQLRNQRVQQVVLGPFATRADAVADLRRLRQLGGHDDANVVNVVDSPRDPSAP